MTRLSCAISCLGLLLATGCESSPKGTVRGFPIHPPEAAAEAAGGKLILKYPSQTTGAEDGGEAMVTIMARATAAGWKQIREETFADTRSRILTFERDGYRAEFFCHWDKEAERWDSLAVNVEKLPNAP